MLRGALFGLAALLAVAPVRADPFDDAVAAHPGFSGAVLVVKDGSIVFDKAYGFADEGRGIANRTSTSFHLGTLSTDFTDLAILHLVNTRKLNLDNTAGQFLPNLTRPAHDLRIREILEDDGPGAPDHHVLLARIAGAALHKPFADGAGAYVFASVWQNGMNWDDGSLGGNSRYAKGYDADARLVTTDWPAVLGADGACSTTRDLLRWIGTHYDDAFLLKEPAPEFPASQQPGFGWARGQHDLFKAGEGHGFAAVVLMRPESHLAVIVLSNRAGTAVGAIAHGLESADAR